MDAHPSYLPRTDLQGKNDWDGLFIAGDRNSKTFSAFKGPRGPAMQQHLLKYGDLCQFTYDNFQVVKENGKATGTLRNSINHMMELPYQYPYPEEGTSTAVAVPEDSPARLYSNTADPVYCLSTTSGYYRGEFPGALFNIQSHNWIGYVAISQPNPNTKLRDIVVAWRGTIRMQEWLSDVADSFVDWDGIGDGNVQVALGFEAMYRHFGATAGNTLSLQGQVQVAVRKLLAQYGSEVGSITTTGHSLGGALASLSAFDIANSQINKQGDDVNGRRIPVTAFTFEAPRVGNAAYAKAFHHPDGGLKQLRVENLKDVVPLAPALAWKQCYWLPPGWPGLVRFCWSFLRSIRGGPESRSSDAFHQPGSLYLVDTDTMYSQNVGVNAKPGVVMSLHQHHGLQLVLHVIDPARPLPVDTQSGIHPIPPPGGKVQQQRAAGGGHQKSEE